MSIIKDLPEYYGLCISVNDDNRRADLLKLLRRGLNTWEPIPKWLVELQVELTHAYRPYQAGTPDESEDTNVD